MTRILILVLTLVLMSGVCSAEEKNIYQKADEVADLYNDCVYLYKSSGLSYKQFDEMYTQATLQKNRFLSKNKDVPLELSDSLNDLDRAFADTRDMWKESIYSNSTAIPKNAYSISLFQRYPRMQSIKRTGIFGMYDTQQILQVLSTYCIEKNDKLQEIIKSGSNPKIAPSPTESPTLK